MSKPFALLDHTGKPFPKDRKAGSRIPSPHAKYDAAQTDAENRRHWANADSLGANAANTPHVRERLREARHDRVVGERHEQRRLRAKAAHHREVRPARRAQSDGMRGQALASLMASTRPG